MTKDDMEQMVEALRAQGLTWGQVNFAVALVRNAAYVAREECAKICDRYDEQATFMAANEIRERNNS